MFCDTGEAPGLCTDGECIEDFCWSNPCDDGNPCTWDQCDSFAQTCWHELRPDGSYCFFDGGGGFGGAGGVPGVCVDGSCAEDQCLGNPCDDGDPCTFDGCNPIDGSCNYQPLPDGAYCSLENGSGGEGGGAAGVCVAGICIENLCIGNPCQDGNPCTSDECNPADGSCTNDPVPDGWFCDAGGAPGYCVAGECVPEESCEGIDCDDGNPCTHDECDPGPGICIHDPYPRDGWPCDLYGAGDGICMEGECVEGPGGSGRNPR